MKALTITLIVIIAVLLVAFVVLYFLGRKAEKKQAEQQKTLEANAQTVNLLVIDKKKLKLKEAGLPSIVVESIIKRRSIALKTSETTIRPFCTIAGNHITIFIERVGISSE